MRRTNCFGLDFAVNIGYQYGCRDIVVNKAATSEEFSNLSTGVADEVVQKFVNLLYIRADACCATDQVK